MAKPDGGIELERKYELGDLPTPPKCLCCGVRLRRESPPPLFLCWQCGEGICDNCRAPDVKPRLMDEYLELIMKPWKDDQSLYCDTKFLEELTHKKIATGEECKH